MDVADVAASAPAEASGVMISASIISSSALPAENDPALPDVFEPVMASRWKKPQHLRGSHFLGTDESGRDVLTRLLHGARVSLSVGFVSVALATAIGLVLGSLAAYYAGWVDIALSRFMVVIRFCRSSAMCLTLFPCKMELVTLAVICFFPHAKSMPRFKARFGG